MIERWIQSIQNDHGRKRGFRPCIGGGEWTTGQSGSSSLKVRTPLTIVETIDWRDMMSSRIAT